MYKHFAVSVLALMCFFGCRGHVSIESKPAQGPQDDIVKELKMELDALRKEVAKYDTSDKDLSKITYQWTEKGIKTSDGRFFALIRSNLVDENGDPIVILEARTSGEELIDRSKMSTVDLIEDFWIRVQDQDLETLALIPSKYDNEGDLRSAFVTISKSELTHFPEDIKKYRIKNANSDKYAILAWDFFKNQRVLQQVPINEENTATVERLRKTELPSVRDQD